MREMEEERLRMREHVMKNVRDAMLRVGGGQQAQQSLTLVWLSRWTPTRTGL